MTLMKIDPFWDIQEWNSVFDHLYRNHEMRVLKDLPLNNWSPTGDISETTTEITFTVELPGFEKDEIDISLNKNVLSISGERKFKENKKRDFHSIERSYGKFLRNFNLPSTVNSKKIDAALKNGVLTIHLPKIKKTEPRQIHVSVS